jgi:hypothetical protein
MANQQRDQQGQFKPKQNNQKQQGQQQRQGQGRRLPDQD